MILIGMNNTSASEPNISKIVSRTQRVVRLVAMVSAMFQERRIFHIRPLCTLVLSL